MKLVVIIMVLFSAIVQAQETKIGEAYYTSKIILNDKDLGLDDNPEILNMLKNSNAFQKENVLKFSKTTSLYKPIETLPEKVSSNISVQSTSDGKIVYQDLVKNILIEQSDFFGKQFLIEEKTTPLRWKTTNETKKIGDYTCYKAILDDSEYKVEAWFTPEIAISSGPENFGGLPGLILELHMDKLIYLCNRVVLSNKNTEKIYPPKKGTKTTREKFNKEVEAKIKDLDMGGSGVKVHTEFRSR